MLTEKQDSIGHEQTSYFFANVSMQVLPTLDSYTKKPRNSRDMVQCFRIHPNVHTISLGTTPAPHQPMHLRLINYIQT